MRTRLAVVIIIALAARAATAQPAPAGAPVDLATLPVLGAPGKAGPIQVHAADADAGRLRNALAQLVRLSFIELPVPDARVTGRLGPVHATALVAALRAGAVGGPVRPLAAAGSSPTVDLDFAGADRDDVFRMLGALMRTNLIVNAPRAQALDLVVRRVPAAQVARVAGARLGLVSTRHGNLTWLRAAGAPALDRALLARKGARKLTLDVKNARAGEVYALLASLGASTGGAACHDGPPVSFRLKNVPVGTALAVTAALSGLPPDAGVSCVAAPGAHDLRAHQLRAIATVGPRRAALFGAGGGATIASRGATLAGARVKDIGEGFVAFELTDGGGDVHQVSSRLHPQDLLVGDDVAAPVGPGLASGPAEHVERLVLGGRLAATIIAGDTTAALFELDHGVWYVLGRHDLRALPSDAVRIEPGKVVYRLDAPSGPRAGEVLLRPRR